MTVTKQYRSSPDKCWHHVFDSETVTFSERGEFFINHIEANVCKHCGLNSLYFDRMYGTGAVYVGRNSQMLDGPKRMAASAHEVKVSGKRVFKIRPEIILVQTGFNDQGAPVYTLGKRREYWDSNITS